MMTAAAQKLYSITAEDCTLPLYVTPNGVHRQPADDLPQLYWPDGTVCWMANMYLLSGYRKGLSRKNNGGTLLTWAKNLSPLIRWCYNNQTDFIDMTDSQFYMFVNSLLAEKHDFHLSEKKRGESHVATICATVLNYFAYIDESLPGLNLLGPAGRIKARKKTHDVTTGRTGKKMQVTSWEHDGVPKQHKSRRRLPISSVAVDRLYSANSTLVAPRFITRRRFVMLRLLEICGGRRIEISFIKVSDIEEAAKTGELKLFSAKKRQNDACRYVPVTQADVSELLSFVKHYRRRVIRATLGFANDHGRLFIAESTGAPLEIDTLGSELSVLRYAAGIDDEEACIHAFRHRFITNIFRSLIRAHHCENASDLKRVLSTETLKAQVAEWTGHNSIAMLDHYIHLAFEAESDYQGTLDIIKAQQVIQSVSTIIKDYGAQLRDAKFTPVTLASLADTLEAASTELQSLLNKKPQKSM